MTPDQYAEWYHQQQQAAQAAAADKAAKDAQAAAAAQAARDAAAAVVAAASAGHGARTLVSPTPADQLRAPLARWDPGLTAAQRDIMFSNMSPTDLEKYLFVDELSDEQNPAALSADQHRMCSQLAKMNLASLFAYLKHGEELMLPPLA